VGVRVTREAAAGGPGAAAREPEPWSVWRQRGGGLVVVLQVVQNVVDSRVRWVVYHDCRAKGVCVRPLADWSATLEVPGREPEPFFTPVA
jgi:hypothetical protein